MKKTLFNNGWKFSNQPGKSLVEMMMGGDDDRIDITLPYDAMIREKVVSDTKNAGQTGFYPGGIYFYTKEFHVPEEWHDKTVHLEFEGIYGKSKIKINGEYAGSPAYGYAGVCVCADDFLKYGEVNHLEVEVNNEMERNSRWYSGSGIYRDVQIYVGGKVHIPVNGLKIATPEVQKELAVAAIEIQLENKDSGKHSIRVCTEIRDTKGNVISRRESPVTLFSNKGEKLEQRLSIAEPALWSCETPDLYTCHVTVREGQEVLDEVEDTFGIRRLQLDPVYGLRINGETVKLRGSCIHHDHGIIGASAFEAAEERKVRLLKEAGFNCIRMSHHPAGKGLLRVCDRLGMLVMDELFDMWTRSKNVNDFSGDFKKCWEEVVTDMVHKDYNHPSVILYSTGNEIQEAGTAKGAQINRMLHQKIKELDNARYTTAAINGILAAGDSFGQIVGAAMGELGIPMPDPQEMAKQSGDVEEKKASEGGSDELNSMMGIMVGPLADAIARNQMITDMTEEFVEAMDIAGYNYLTGRHALEHQLFPNRVVLGTETFPADIVNLWKCVKENPHVIGDMTWTGYDYLGEAGVGVFHYDGGMNFNASYPDRVAYIGDIDIAGNRRPISYYREIVYGLRKTPYIAVERVNRYGQTANKTPWMWKDNIESWTWPGYEGKPALVDVLSDAEEVELFLNGKSLGRKPAGEDNEYMAVFELTYEPGELKAVAVRDGVASEEFIIRTAGEVAELKVEADKTVLAAGGNDLSYINMTLTDANGVENLNVEKNVSIRVEGAAVLEGFGSARPVCEESYQETTCKTYDGKLLAAIRSGTEPGEAMVVIRTEGCGEKAIKLTVR